MCRPTFVGTFTFVAAKAYRLPCKSPTVSRFLDVGSYAFAFVLIIVDVIVVGGAGGGSIV